MTIARLFHSEIIQKCQTHDCCVLGIWNLSPLNSMAILWYIIGGCRSQILFSFCTVLQILIPYFWKYFLPYLISGKEISWVGRVCMYSLIIKFWKILRNSNPSGDEPTMIWKLRTILYNYDCYLFLIWFSISLNATAICAYVKYCPINFLNPDAIKVAVMWFNLSVQP